MRLADFNSALVGYVEICHNETWTKLLTEVDSWTHKNSIVVCQQLGYLGALRLHDQSRYNAIEVYINIIKTCIPMPSATVTTQCFTSQPSTGKLGSGCKCLLRLGCQWQREVHVVNRSTFASPMLPGLAKQPAKQCIIDIAI